MNLLQKFLPARGWVGELVGDRGDGQPGLIAVPNNLAAEIQALKPGQTLRITMSDITSTTTTTSHTTTIIVERK